MSDSPASDRRDSERLDRRRKSRGGRRSADPRVNWRRIAWWFAAYGTYLSLRALPSTLRRVLKRDAPDATRT